MRTILRLAAHSVSIGLLLSQAQDFAMLEEDYLRTVKGAKTGLVTIIATHLDGSPLRGTISCEGWWFKYADEMTVLDGVGLPFKTDMRGAIGMNPSHDMETMTCWAEKDGMVGAVTFVLPGTHVATFTLDRKVGD